MTRGHRTGSTRSWLERLHCRLVRLLPFEFRSEFGHDIRQAFAEEHDDIRARRSVRQTLAFWLRTIGDIARTAPRQHWDMLRQDVRLGINLLKRSPGFATAAILIVALGIGGSTGIFSVVYAVVLRPLAFPESDRVVRIGWSVEGDGGGLQSASYQDLQTIRSQVAAFELVGATRYDQLTSDRGRLHAMIPVTLPVGGVGQGFVTPMMASEEVFAIFGSPTALGRLPDEHDERPDSTPTAVLSHSTWTSLYGRDPNVVGRSLSRLHGGGRKSPVTIVGVLAPNAFRYPFIRDAEIPAWSSIDQAVADGRDSNNRPLPYLSIYARLAKGVSMDMAQAQLAAITPALLPNLRDDLLTKRPTLRATRLRDDLAKDVRLPLLAFLGAVSCLLLLACANVTSLVVARSISRGQEFATRFALGARPLRVARQLLTESALIALAGGTLGLVLAWAARDAFMRISPSMPRLEESGIGIPALAFAVSAMLLTMCLAGVIPAMQASRRGVADGLKRAGSVARVGTALSRPLTLLGSLEIALVLLLLVGTGLLVNSFTRLVLFDLGVNVRSVVMLTLERQVPPGSTASAADAPVQTAAVLTAQQRQMVILDDDVVERVSRIPGVLGAGITGDDPFGPPYRYGRNLEIGGAEFVAAADFRLVGPTAFDALNMRIAEGRGFDATDRAGSPLVTLVNRTMAQRFWPGRSPLGDTLRSGNRSFQIVGIVEDIRQSGARREVRPAHYVSTNQMPPSPAMLVVKTLPGLKSAEAAIAAALTGMAGRLTTHSFRRPEDMWRAQVADTRFLTLVLSVFSALSLVVALSGVVAILRFLVAQRTRELGIRKALGATHGQLVALVLRQALRLTWPGCAVGLFAALLLAPAISSMLFGITPTDPVTLIAVTALLVITVLTGAYFPARRAGAVDPAVSLSAE